jgi:hypothetical protein
VSGLKAMHGVGGSQLAGLHDEGAEARNQGKENQGISEPASGRRCHG